MGISEEIITEFPSEKHLQPKPCPHCRRTVKGGGLKFKNREIEGHHGILYWGECECGNLTKFFEDIWKLMQWWNTRGGKVPPIPTVSTKQRRFIKLYSWEKKLGEE